MKLGTHNSMTYLKPKHWWLYPFKFIAQCQDLTIEEQYEFGIRNFDLRISYTKDGELEFRHGLIAYKGDVLKTLEYLNSRSEPVYVKFWLECTKEDLRQEELFKFDCKSFEEQYSNIKFYGGKSKAKSNLYNFKNTEPQHNSKFASLQPPLIDDLWPKLYAKLHNKKTKEKYNTGLLVLDFVEIG